MIPTVEMIEAGWKATLGLNKLQVERILVAALAVARGPAVTDDMVNAADSVLSRRRPGIPDETIRLAISAALDVADKKHAQSPQPRAAIETATDPSAENKRLREALDSIIVYGADTLSGRADGPSDAAWYREAVREMRNRARSAATKEQAP